MSQTAEPTPGPYYVHLPRRCVGGCRTIRTAKGRMHGTYGGTEIAWTAGLRNDAEDKANAELLAASWDTAAERDRFEAALNRIAWDVDNGHPLGDSGIFMQQIARAVLPKPPEPV